MKIIATCLHCNRSDTFEFDITPAPLDAGVQELRNVTTSIVNDKVGMINHGTTTDLINYGNNQPLFAPLPVVGSEDKQYSQLTENKWPINGYAPGTYMCGCGVCKKDFYGDKHAVACEPCATKGIEFKNGEWHIVNDEQKSFEFKLIDTLDDLVSGLIDKGIAVDNIMRALKNKKNVKLYIQ